jgi:protein-tyrosine kinase
MEQIKQAIAMAKAAGARVPRAPLFAPAPAAPAMAQQHSLAAVPARPFQWRNAIKIGLDRAHLERCRIVAHAASNPMSSGFDMLRTKLLQEMQARSWKTLLITSPTAGCGKTVTAINLAMSIARQPDKFVILADCDLRKPQVAADLGFKPAADIVSVVEGRAALEDALFQTDVGGPNLLVLPALSGAASPADILSSPRMADLVDALKDSRAEVIVIFDMPPMLVSDDVIAFMPRVDGVLLVVAANQTKLPEIENCERNLPESKYLGTLLSKSLEATDSYKYY